MAGELVFTPDSYNFNKVSIGNTKKTTIVITNVSEIDVTFQNLELPEGYTYKFINEYPAYQPYDFHSIYQDGLDIGGTTYKGFKNIFIDHPNQVGGTFINTNKENKLLKVYIPLGCNQYQVDIKVTDNDSTIAFAKYGIPPTQYYEDEETGLTTYIYEGASKEYCGNLATDLTQIQRECPTIPTDDGTIKMYKNYIDPGNNFDIVKYNYSGKWLYIIVVTTGTVESTVISYSMKDDITKLDTSNWLSNGDPPDDYLSKTIEDIEEEQDSYNDTGYTSYTDILTRFPNNTSTGRRKTGQIQIRDKYTSNDGGQFGNCDTYKNNYRMFLPPGSNQVSIGDGKNSFALGAVGKLGSPPDGNEGGPKYDSYATQTNNTTKETKTYKFDINDSVGGADYYRCNECYSWAMFQKVGFGSTITRDSCELGTYSYGLKEEIQESEKDKLNCGYNGVTTFDDATKKLYVFNSDGKGANANFIGINTSDNEILTYKNAGWFYARHGRNDGSVGGDGPCGGGGVCMCGMNQAIMVDVEKYNEWWDNGGTGNDGSIDYYNDIEAFETYPGKEFEVQNPIPKTINTSINPTSYITVHYPYYKYPENVGFKIIPATSGVAATTESAYTFDYWLPTDENFEGINNSLKKVRIFVPPGTVEITMSGSFSGSGETYNIISRYNTQPTTTTFPSTNPRSNCYNLTELGEDCYSKFNKTDTEFKFVYQDLHSGALPNDSGGWLYVKCDNCSFKTTIFVIKFHLNLYNDWWKKCGSNSDKSINWETDVEKKEKYSIVQ